jgi:hypothetical protein
MLQSGILFNSDTFRLQSLLLRRKCKQRNESTAGVYIRKHDKVEPLYACIYIYILRHYYYC